MLASLQTQLAMMHKELIQDYAMLAYQQAERSQQDVSAAVHKAVALIIHGPVVSLVVDRGQEDVATELQLYRQLAAWRV